MATPNAAAPAGFVRAGTLDELKTRGKIVVSGQHCPHLGFPLHRGTVEDGILTCHWHHARFDLASGGGFDLWADEAGIGQAREWGDAPEARTILVALARYLAAHSPTERSELQTATVARKLARGEALHDTPP